MSQEIIGIVTKAIYKDCLLTGIFKDDKGKEYEIINARGNVCEQLVGNKRLITFYKDKDNPTQDYLEDPCLSIKLENINPCTWKLDGSDFINQADTFIFLKDESGNNR